MAAPSQGSDNGDSLRYGHLEKCLENFIKSHRDKPGSCKKLAKAFPEIHEQNPAALKLMSDSIGEKYTELLEKSINELLKTIQIKEKLKELESYPENSGHSWRPSGTPEKDLRAHIGLVKHGQIQKLKQKITEEEEGLNTLRESLTEKEKLIEKKLLHVNSIAEELTSTSQKALSHRDDLYNQVKNLRDALSQNY